jgi:hypothetical protein
MLVPLIVLLALCEGKFFGVGLSKTGTTSLGLAFEQLGLRNLHMDRSFIPFLSSTGNYNFTGQDFVATPDNLTIIYRQIQPYW